MEKNVIIPRRGALGKGIQSLLGDAPEPEVALQNKPAKNVSMALPEMPANQNNGFFRIHPNLIEANPNQPRKIFDEKKLKELAASLAVDGVLQPLIVTIHPKDPKKYLLIAGERRLRAARLADLAEVPVILKTNVQDDLLRLALIENIQRSDLNVIEEAIAYEALIKEQGLTQDQCADRVGKDRSTVANILRLLQLPREVQDDVVEERLTMGHARALLSLEDKKTMLRARDVIIKKALNVRQTEQLIKNFRAGAAAGKNLPKNKADLDYLAENLRSQLRTKVRLTGNGSKGKIEISYFSASELERILAVLGHSA